MSKGKIKEKAAEAVQEALDLNDTSVDAKMLLNGTEYEIEMFNIQFQKDFDYKGEPQREVKGGLIYVTINHVVDEQINNWMFNRGVKHSGAIVFASFSRIASPVIIVEFVNGRCAQYSKSLGTSTVSYTILISAEEITVNEIDHTNLPD